VNNSDTNVADGPQLRALPSAPSTEHVSNATMAVANPDTFWNLTAQDLMTAGVSLLSSWPLAILIALCFLRSDIKTLLGRLFRWSGFGVDMEFRESVNKLFESSDAIQSSDVEPQRALEEKTTPASELSTAPARELSASNEGERSDDLDRVQRLLQVSPRAVVVEAFSDLEEKARSLGTAMNVSPPRLSNVVKTLVEQKKIFPSATRNAIELNDLRNRVVYSTNDAIAPEDALRYWAIADKLGREFIEILKNMPGKYTIVYKGGPDNGFIDTGQEAASKVELLAMKHVGDTNRWVVGEPEIGQAFQGAPKCDSPPLSDSGGAPVYAARTGAYSVSN